MRKIRLIALALCAVVLLITGCGEKPPVKVPDGYKIASDDSADYYFFVPTNWVVDIKAAATSAYVSAVDPASVSVMTWSSTNSDATLAAWWDSFKPDVEKVYDHFAVETEEDMLVDKCAARSVVYTGSIGGTEYRFRQISTIKGGVIYVLTYTNVAANYEDHAADFTDMVDFFLFK